MCNTGDTEKSRVFEVDDGRVFDFFKSSKITEESFFLSLSLLLLLFFLSLFFPRMMFKLDIYIYVYGRLIVR